MPITDQRRADGRPGGPAGATIRELTVRFGSRTVLRDINLEFDQRIVSLVGPNGAGKSTLLRVLATLVPLSHGRVELAGNDLSTRAGRAAARRQLGFLSQEPEFPPHFSVREALMYASWLHRVPSSRRSARVDDALQELDLTEVADNALGTLSTGTRRRVFIGQSLTHRPSVLLLDEPTIGIDAEHRVGLRRLINRLAKGRLAILTTHLTEDIELLAERVVVVRDGAVCFDGSPVDLAALGGRDGQSADERAVERGLRVAGGIP